MQKQIPFSDQFMMMSQHKNQSLAQLIDKLMTGNQPTDIELQQLSDVELAIYMKTKDKKNNSCTRRPDQLQKMFYKRVMKYAEEIYFKKRKTKRINMFYRHYFEEVAEKMGCSIMNFYHPDKQIKSNKKSGQKTFNNTYVKLILSSATFRAVCREYLEKFIEENQRERKKKIQKLIESCWKVINKTDHFQKSMFKETPKEVMDTFGLNLFETDERYWASLEILPQPEKYAKKEIHSIQQLQEYFKSSKCKIPWSDRELEETKKFAFKQLENHEEK